MAWSGPIGLAWPQSWPGPNLGYKVGPKQIFGPGFKSWPDLKFGLLNNAWPQHIIFQTDIFSVILIGFID